MGKTRTLYRNLVGKLFGHLNNGMLIDIEMNLKAPCFEDKEWMKVVQYHIL
jgi:hypothetical protein